MKREAKRPKLYQTTGERVKHIMNQAGVTMTELCEMIPGDGEDGHVALPTMSQIVNGYKPLTDSMARKIIAAFPSAGYNLAWLMGYSDLETERDTFREEFIAFKNEMDMAADNQKKLLSAVADIMSLYGLEWDGKTTISPLSARPSGTYKGTPFDSLELKIIAEKIYRIVGLELEFAAYAKNENK